MRPDVRLEAHFLQQPRFLLAARFPDLFLLFVAELRVVQDLADRRSGLRRYLDEIPPPAACQGQGFREGFDAKLCPVRVDDADLTGCYPVVDPRRVLRSPVYYCGFVLSLVISPSEHVPARG